MIGMPMPKVEPSLWYSRTCTGRPVGAGELDGDAAPGPADEPERPDCQLVDGPDEHATSRPAAIPRTARTRADRHRCRGRMNMTMLRDWLSGYPNADIRSLVAGFRTGSSTPGVHCG